MAKVVTSAAAFLHGLPPSTSRSLDRVQLSRDHRKMKTQVIAIVSSDGPANVGDLFVFLCPVGDVAVGYRPRLAVAGNIVARTIWFDGLAHVAEDIAGFG